MPETERDNSQMAVSDGEQYYYQQLLLNVCFIKDDLHNNMSKTYKEECFSRNIKQEYTATSIELQRCSFLMPRKELITNLEI